MNELTKIIAVAAMAVLAVLAVEALAWQAGYISINLSGTPAGGVQQNIGIPVPTDMRALNGTVQEVGSSFVKFKLSPSPFDIPGSSVRTAEVNENTVVEKLTPKDVEVIDKETQEFFRKTQSGAAPETGLTPPDPFIRTKILLNDIKVGDNIIAYANENIIEADKFTATMIQEIQAPALPAASPPTQ